MNEGGLVSAMPGGRGVFAAALRGGPRSGIGLPAPPYRLPVQRWEDPADLLDLGVLGPDVMPPVAAPTRVRGAGPLLRELFGPVPGEGRWDTAAVGDDGRWVAGLETGS